MMSSKITAVFIVIAIFVFGCGKDTPKPNNNSIPSSVSRKCPPLLIRYDNFRELSYKYNAQGQLISLDETIQFEEIKLFEYNTEGQIIKASFYPRLDTISWKYHEFLYNINGKVVRLNNFAKDLQGQFKEGGYTTFHYDNLGNLTEWNQFYSVNDVNPSIKSLYSYFPNGEIEEKIAFDNTRNGNFQFYTYTNYSFDNKKNPFKDLPEALKIDDALLSGYKFSDHNVILRRSGNIGAPLPDEEVTTTYQYNSDGYPIKATSSDKRGFYNMESNYSYNCQ